MRLCDRLFGCVSDSYPHIIWPRALAIGGRVVACVSLMGARVRCWAMRCLRVSDGRACAMFGDVWFSVCLCVVLLAHMFGNFWLFWFVSVCV